MRANQVRSFSLAVCLLCSVTPLFFTGCSRSPANQNGPAASGQPLTVSVERPSLKTLKRLTEQPARIEAWEEAPIYVKIAGYVEKVHVEIGQKVKQGDCLADLRVPELQKEYDHKCGLVDQAEIDITLAKELLAVAQANVKTSELLVEETKFTLDRAEAVLRRWRSEAARVKKLADDKVVSAQDSDETNNQYLAASAARDEVEAKQRTASASLTESRARSRKAQAEVQAAENRKKLAEAEKLRLAALLDYSHVRAPFDGIVSDRNIHRGHFLQPSSSNTPLFVVVANSKVRVFVDVPETEAVLIKQGIEDGCTAQIRVPVLNDREFTGKVVGTSGSLDSDQRTLRTEIDLDNIFDADNPHGLLRPGMYAHASIEVDQKNAWTIATSAITTRDGQTYCFVVQNGKAVKTIVKIGPRYENEVQLLKKLVPPTKPGGKPKWIDFTGDEAVIVESNGDLADAAEVRISERVH